MRFIAFLFVLATAASAQTNSNVQTFGMSGIASGQTARLNVLNVGGQGQTATCLASLVFLDDQVSVLKTKTVSVEPGRSVSLDLLADADLGLATSERRQVRAVVALIPADQPQPGCKVAPTLEIFEQSTGKTSVLVTKTIPIPQPSAPTTQP
jgi:hypothetical protein